MDLLVEASKSEFRKRNYAAAARYMRDAILECLNRVESLIVVCPQAASVGLEWCERCKKQYNMLLQMEKNPPPLPPPPPPSPSPSPSPFMYYPSPPPPPSRPPQPPLPLLPCFDDLMGMESVKEQLRESVIWPITSLRAQHSQHERPKPLIVLLNGPPGCGKTSIAEAVAGQIARELNQECRFVKIKAAEVVSKFVGESQRNVTRMLEEGKMYPRCVFFYDEADGMIVRREHSDGTGGNGVKADVLTTLLTELEDPALAHTVHIFATNLTHTYDEALESRKTVSIYIPLPTAAERLAYLRKRGVVVTSKEEADALMNGTDGLSYRDMDTAVKNVLNHADYVLWRNVTQVVLDADNVHVRPFDPTRDAKESILTEYAHWNQVPPERLTHVTHATVTEILRHLGHQSPRPATTPPSMSPSMSSSSADTPPSPLPSPPEPPASVPLATPAPPDLDPAAPVAAATPAPPQPRRIGLFGRHPYGGWRPGR